MKIEDYFKYYIQGSDHYLIPKDVFKELFNEMINWREESKILRENAEHNDKVVELLKEENEHLRIQVSAREEVANKYKKVIDETRHYVEKECNDLLIGYFHNRFDTTEYYEKLLQILDKGESNE